MSCKTRSVSAEAKTIQETKNILDLADAAETYAKRHKLGEEVILKATSIKIEALSQLGRMLQETPRAKGGESYKPYKKIPPLPMWEEWNL